MFRRKRKVVVPLRMQGRMQFALAGGKADMDTRARFWDAVNSAASYTVQGDYADMFFVDEAKGHRYEINALIEGRTILVGGLRVHRVN